MDLGQQARESAEMGITAVAGLKVGHHTVSARPTGCTVVLCEAGAIGGVDVRGSAPGTRETDLLNPVNTVQKVHAVVLSGGSAFGLDAATGVVRFLEEHGIGFDAKVARVPIVPAAVLFDLQIGDARIRPDREAGYQACRSATIAPVAEGSVGAGAGATVGKMFGMASAMKGGIGTAAIRLNSGLVVGALVAVNAGGDVIDRKTGKLLAGARTPDGRRLLGAVEQLKSSVAPVPLWEGTDTTLGVVATNAKLSKSEVTKVAQMAHDGIARTINPAHTPSDGDTIFALATGAVGVSSSVGLIGALAAEAVSDAVVRAIVRASGLPGIPSYSDLFGTK